MPAGANVIFSIGHSNHSWSFFLSLIRARQIEVLADVRFCPYSRFAPVFTKAVLKKNCRAERLEYLFLGRELGGLRREPDVFDGSGRMDRGKVVDSSIFQKGLDILTDKAARKMTAVMCAEEDPRRCHRSWLLEPVLRARGFNLVHIRRDGEPESDGQSTREDRLLKLFDI